MVQRNGWVDASHPLHPSASPALRDGSVVSFSIILTYDGGIEQQIWKPRFRRQEVEDKENFLKLVFAEMTREEAENICVIDTCQHWCSDTRPALDWIKTDAKTIFHSKDYPNPHPQIEILEKNEQLKRRLVEQPRSKL